MPWLLVPMRVDADLRLRPPRTSAGETVEASLTATNRGALPLWQPLLRLPVGDRDSWVRMPSLDRGGRERAEVLVDDLARGVLQVGPATAIRADPLGLLHRPVRWGGARRALRATGDGGRARRSAPARSATSRAPPATGSR